MVKLNSGDFLRGGFTEDDALQVLALLDREAVDLVEISGGRYESAASFGHASAAASAREAYFHAFAHRAREATRAARMLTGGLRSRAAMDAALAEGALEVVGIARPMAQVPDYPRRLLAHRPVPPIAAPSLGLRRLFHLEASVELAWFYRQLARMGAGADPALSRSSLRAFLVLMSFLLGELLRSWTRRTLSSSRVSLVEDTSNMLTDRVGAARHRGSSRANCPFGSCAGGRL
jgi:hypothetical protein